jgi:hypothetical protein
MQWVWFGVVLACQAAVAYRVWLIAHLTDETHPRCETCGRRSI